jgi:hypothetical protein
MNAIEGCQRLYLSGRQHGRTFKPGVRPYVRNEIAWTIETLLATLTDVSMRRRPDTAVVDREVI